MRKNYKIMYFVPEYAQLGIKFEGLDCYNFRAPFKDGAYLNGQELDDYIQLVYPYTVEEFERICPTLTGAEYIESLVEVQTVDPASE